MNAFIRSVGWSLALLVASSATHGLLAQSHPVQPCGFRHSPSTFCPTCAELKPKPAAPAPKPVAPAPKPPATVSKPTPPPVASAPKPPVSTPTPAPTSPPAPPANPPVTVPAPAQPPVAIATPPPPLEVLPSAPPPVSTTTTPTLPPPETQPAPVVVQPSSPTVVSAPPANEVIPPPAAATSTPTPAAAAPTPATPTATEPPAQSTYRDQGPSVATTENHEEFLDIADQLRHESVKRAQSRLGYGLRSTSETGSVFDQRIRQQYRVDQEQQFAAAQALVRQQAGRLGAMIATPTAEVLLTDEPCAYPPFSDADISRLLEFTSDSIDRMQEHQSARGNAEAAADAVLDRSNGLASAGEGLLNKFGFGNHLAQAGILGIALDDGGICGRGGPIDDPGPPPFDPTLHPYWPWRMYPPGFFDDEEEDDDDDPAPLDDPLPPKKGDKGKGKKDPDRPPRRDACADALNTMGVDPAIAAIARNNERMAEVAYEDAAADLLPGDFSQRQLTLAAMDFAGVVADDHAAMEFEDSASKLTEAVRSRREVIDTVLAAPQETFADLVLTASATKGAAPVHALLTPDDAIAAHGLTRAVRDPSIRQKIELAETALRTRDAEAPALAVEAMHAISGIDVAKARGALTPLVTLEAEATALKLVEGIVRELPLLAELEKLEPVAARVASATAVEFATSQVFFSEVVGRDALLAGRSVTAKPHNGIAAVERSGDAFNRLISLNPHRNLIEVLSQPNPIDPQRVELHRRRVELAKSAVGESTVAVALAKNAPAVARAEAGLEVAGVTLAESMRRVSDPAVRALAAEVPVLARTASLLKARLAAAEAGVVTRDPAAVSTAQQDLTATESQLTASLNRIQQLGARLPDVTQRVEQFDAARATLSTELDRLAKERPDSPAAQDRIESLNQQRFANLRTTAMDLGVPAALPLAASLALLPDARTGSSARLNTADATALRVAGETATRSAIAVPTGENTATAKRLLAVEKLDQRAAALIPLSTAVSAAINARSALNAGSAVARSSGAPFPPSAPNLQDAAHLTQQIRATATGAGFAQSFVSESAIQPPAPSSPTLAGAVGMVHSVSDLNDPAYREKLFEDRVGGYGYTHEFESEQDLQQFAQSRVGQFGMVHLKSDLEDPAYFKELFDSRVGGAGWSHTFKDLDEMKTFMESRLGGLGRVSTCLDLINRGVPPAMASAIMEDAASRSKKNFESDAQYQERMLRDRSDRFTRDANGVFREKSAFEQEDDRRQAMLATGDWVEDARTGNLVKRDSKAGEQVLDRMLDAKPRTVRVQLTGGRWLELPVDGFSSLQSSLDDAMTAQGFKRNSQGDWIDSTGNLALSGTSAAHYDQDYREAMDSRAPGFSELLTYRRPQDRPGVPPQPVRDQFAELENQLRNGFGYTIDDFKIGDRMIDLEVRPGESVTDALARQLADDPRFSFNSDGDLIDRRTGKPARNASDLAEIDGRYRERVANAVFGDKYGEISRETLFLAEHGTAAQRAQAQAVLTKLTTEFAQLNGVTAAQQQLLDEMAEIGADRSLTQSQKSARQRELQTKLDQLAEQRSQLEYSIVANAHSANESAQRVVQSELSYSEKQALAAGDKVKTLADRVFELNAALDRHPSPTEQRNLERELREVQLELLSASRSYNDAERDLPPGSAVLRLAPEVDLAGLRITSATMADAREARANAAGVRYDPENKTAFYVNAAGNPLVDVNGRAIAVSETEAHNFERAQIKDLTRNYDDYVKADADYAKRLNRIKELQAQIAAETHSPTRRDLQRKLDAATLEAGELKGQLDAYIASFNNLATDDHRQKIRDDAAALAIEIEATKEALAKGASSIQVLDENGQWVMYENPAMRQLRAEREARLLAAGVTDPELLAAARAAANPPTTPAPDPAVSAATAEAARLSREQQSRLASDYQAHAAGLRAAESNFADAEKRLREAEAAAFGRQDPALDQAVASAREAYAAARSERDRQAMETSNAAAIAGANDPELAARLNTLTHEIEQQQEAAKALDGLAQSIRRQLAQEGIHPALASALQTQLAGIEASRAQVAREAMSTAALLGAARDNAAFGDVTPEYNAARLSALQDRVRWSGKPAAESLSSLELEELERRTAIAEYFDHLDNAHDHLRELAELTNRQRTNPSSLTIEEKVALDRGLSETEMRVLLGETQRQGVLQAATLTDDPQQAEMLRSLVTQWMADPTGGKNGATLLHDQGIAEFGKALGFLDRTDLYTAARDEASQRLATRKAELEAALAEFERDPTSANARIVSSTRDSVESAETLLADANERLNTALAAAPTNQVNTTFANSAHTRAIEQLDASQFELESARARHARDPSEANAKLLAASESKLAQAEALSNETRAQLDAVRAAALASQPAPFATLPKSQGYIERTIAEQNAAALAAQQAELARLVPFEAAKKKFESAVKAVDRIQADYDNAAVAIQQHLSQREREFQVIQNHYAEFERHLAEDDPDDADRAFYEKRMKELKAELDLKAAGIHAVQMELAGNEEARQEALAATLKQAPPLWERDPAYRAQEEQARLTALFQANHELAQLHAGHSAKLAQFDSRVQDFERQLAAARDSGDAARIAALESAVADSKLQRAEFAVVMSNNQKMTEQARFEQLARNRADRIGPGDDYQLDKYLESLGVDPKTAYSLDADLIAQQRAAVDRAVDAAVASNISKANPSLARLYAEQVVAEAEWSDIPKGAIGGLVGAGKGAVHLVASVPDLISMAGKGVYFAGKLGLETAAATGDLLAETLAGRDLGLMDTVGTGSLDSVNRGLDLFQKTSLSSVVNKTGAIAGNLVDQTLRNLEKGDSDWNAAMLGGRVTFEVGIGFVNPASAVSTVARAGEGLAALGGARGVAAWTAFAEQAASKGAAVAAAGNKVLQPLADARAALNQSALGQAVNNTSLGRSFIELPELSRAEAAVARQLDYDLKVAEALVADAARASPERAAELLQQANQARAAALDQLVQSSPSVIQYVNAKVDVKAAVTSIVNHAQREAALLASGVRATPEGLAAASSQLNDVRTGAAALHGPIDPLESVRQTVQAKGMTPQTAQSLLASEVEAMARLRAGAEARALQLENALKTSTAADAVAVQHDLDIVRHQVDVMARDEKVLRALAEPDNALAQADAMAAVIASQPAPGVTKFSATADAARNAEGVNGWLQARNAAPNLERLQQLVIEGKELPINLVMDLKADPRAMRSLKNAPGPVRTAFNKTEQSIYDQHDAALLAAVREIKTLDQHWAPDLNPSLANPLTKNQNDLVGLGIKGSNPETTRLQPAPWADPDVEIRVHDFRTPGAAPGSVNTDRDYRVIYKVTKPDGKEEWIEVPRKHWEEFSKAKFAGVSGYSPEKLRELAAAEDLAAWDAWNPADHGGVSLDAEMKHKWAEIHQQLATDRPHPEASLDFSDQYRDADGILRQRADPNIIAVKEGKATLQDAQRLGMMYNEKPDAYLRLKTALYPEGDKLEAMAQMNKAIEMLNAVRDGYIAQGIGVGKLSPRFEDAMRAVQELGPFDHSVSAERILAAEAKLHELGFGTAQGRSLAAFKEGLDSQFHALNMAETKIPRIAARPTGALPDSPPPEGTARFTLEMPEPQASYRPVSPRADATVLPDAPVGPAAANTIYRQLPQTAVGDAGKFQFMDSTGVVHELGEFFGQGTYSRVYAAAGAGNEGMVIKFRVGSDADFGVSASDMVHSAALASERLADAKIPQMHVVGIQTNGRTPYAIVEKLPKGTETFKMDALLTRESRNAAGWTPDHDRAVVKLYEDLADNGLVAEDLHAENLYFFKQDDRIVAGVLDHDRILPWEQATESYWMKNLLENPIRADTKGIRSFAITGAESFASPHEFMARMLEHKQWIEQTSLFKPGFSGRRLDLESLRGSKLEPYLNIKGASGDVTPLFPNTANPTSSLHHRFDHLVLRKAA